MRKPKKITGWVKAKDLPTKKDAMGEVVAVIDRDDALSIRCWDLVDPENDRYWLKVPRHPDARKRKLGL